MGVYSYSDPCPMSKDSSIQFFNHNLSAPVVLRVFKIVIIKIKIWLFSFHKLFFPQNNVKPYWCHIISVNVKSKEWFFFLSNLKMQKRIYVEVYVEFKIWQLVWIKFVNAIMQMPANCAKNERNYNKII